MRLRIRAILALLALAVPLALAAGVSGPAAAAVTPHGTTNNACYQNPSANTCDNTDPFATDCNLGSYVANSQPVYWYDAENGKLTGGYSGYIQNWYSPHCGTNWARYVDASGVTGQADIITCLNNQFVHCTDWYYSAVLPAWSNQLYARTTVATAFADFTNFVGGTASGSASA
jgi:hypothetical protein